MKIGVADWGLFVWNGGLYDYEDRIEMVRGLGFDGLERIYPKSPEDALNKVAFLKKRGMSFATCNNSDHELAIKWTAALGGEYIWAEGMNRNSFEIYLRQVDKLTRAAEKYGVKVAVHNHLGSLAETQEQVETVLRECPKVNLLFDTGHLAVAGGDVRYIADKYYDRIVSYHLKGWQTSDKPDDPIWSNRGYFCGLAQGDFFIDNEYVFKNAVRKNFGGWVMIEHDTHKREPELDLAESMAVLRKWQSEV